jgi:hypothetical protein
MMDSPRLATLPADRDPKPVIVTNQLKLLDAIERVRLVNLLPEARRPV